MVDKHVTKELAKYIIPDCPEEAKGVIVRWAARANYYYQQEAKEPAQDG